MVDEVLPNQAVRQWVLSFPFQLRLLLAIRPKIMGKCLAIATMCISNHLIKKAGLKKAKAKTGTVTLIQRFGGSINLNVHFHQLTIDGAYELDENLKPTIFHPTSAPTVPELQSVLAAIIKKITKYLEKSQIIIKDDLVYATF